MTCYDNCYGSFILTLWYCPVRCIIFYIMLHVNFMILYRALPLSARILWYKSWSWYGIIQMLQPRLILPYSFLWCQSFISCYHQCNDSVSCHVFTWVIKISYDNYLWIWYKLTQCYKYFYILKIISKFTCSVSITRQVLVQISLQDLNKHHFNFS